MEYTRERSWWVYLLQGLLSAAFGAYAVVHGVVRLVGHFDKRPCQYRQHRSGNSNLRLAWSDGVAAAVRYRGVCPLCRMCSPGEGIESLAGELGPSLSSALILSK